MIDARGNVVAVSSGANEEGHGSGGDVLRRHGAKDALDLDFALGRRQVDQAAQPLGGWDIGEQIVDGADADAGEHGGTVFVGVREIAHGSSLLKSCAGIPGRSRWSSAPRLPSGWSPAA